MTARQGKGHAPRSAPAQLSTEGVPMLRERLEIVQDALILAHASIRSLRDVDETELDRRDVCQALYRMLDASMTELYWVLCSPDFVLELPAPDDYEARHAGGSVAPGAELDQRRVAIAVQHLRAQIGGAR